MPVLVRRLSLLLLILGATPAWPDAELARRFEAASPAVVTIRTVERSPTPGPDGAVAMRSTGGLGSGVLIDDDGLIATAAHVVQTAEEVAVSFEDGTVLPARILASEVPSDLALLRVERVPDGMSPAKLADAPPPVGEDIFVVGALRHRTDPVPRHRLGPAHGDQRATRRSRGVRADRRIHQHGELWWTDVRHARARGRHREQHHQSGRRF